MLSSSQIGRYQTCGFLVLPGFLSDLIRPLRQEADTALREAYAATFDERVVEGISGHYLPVTSRLTPVSANLVCDDPRFIDAAEALLDGPVLPECPEAILYFFDAGWHNDDGIGVRGVKFVTYFDDLSASNGALRLLPGSHRPEEQARLTAARASRQLGASGPLQDHGGPPCFIAETSPGDVVAFDLHTWHASFGGRDRLAWSILYQRWPETEQDRARTLRSMADSFEQAYRGFDRERYPTWRDWRSDPHLHPGRARVLARLRDVGALSLEGADIGW